MTVNTVTNVAMAQDTANNPTTLYPTVWYSLHEGSGTSFTEGFGNGYTLDVGGTTTSLWSVAGSAKPNATDLVAVKGASATAPQIAYVDAIFNFQTLKTNGGVLYFGYEIGIPGSNSASGTVLHWGRNNATFGGVWFDVNGSDQPTMNIKGDGSSTTNTLTVGRALSDSYSGMKAVVGEFYFSDSNTLVGTYHIEGVSSGTNTLDLTGVTMPTGSTEGLIMMGRRASGTSYANFLGSGSSFIDNVFAQRRTTYDPLLGPAVLADMIANRRAFPKTLRT